MGRAKIVSKIADGIKVSIPQSEFCPLGLVERLLICGVIQGFQFLSRNSVRWDLHRRVRVGAPGVVPFQFLSRNSVRWDTNAVAVIRSVGEFQFLSRNSVRWDRVMQWRIYEKICVSIPQSEFCPLGLLIWVTRPIIDYVRFNSSVGILSVGTPSFKSVLFLSQLCFNSSVGILSVGT